MFLRSQLQTDKTYILIFECNLTYISIQSCFNPFRPYQKLNTTDRQTHILIFYHNFRETQRHYGLVSSLPIRPYQILARKTQFNILNFKLFFFNASLTVYRILAAAPIASRVIALKGTNIV